MAKKDSIKEAEWKNPRSKNVEVLGYIGKIIDNKEQSYKLLDDDKGILPIELQNLEDGKVAIIKAYDNQIER